MKKAKPVSAGQNIELSIESLAPGGKGVGKVEGFPIFVERVAPGDTIKADIYDVRKSFALAKAEEIISPSSARQEPICDVFERCGGCQWQHIKYQEQLEAKKDIVVQSMQRIGGISDDIIDDTIGASHHMKYRNKVQFPVKSGPKGLEAGYFERNSHILVDIESCPVQPEPLDCILQSTKEALKEANIAPYNEKTHNGLIRHIVARQSIAKGDILLTLVLNLKSIEKVSESLMQKLNSIANSLKEKNPGLTGICLNFNDKKGNRILSENTVCINGSEFIEEVLSAQDSSEKEGIKFRLSANSFFQIHTGQAVRLLEEVSKRIESIGDSQNLTIFDAYAGVGTIALWIAKKAKKVYAIESNPFAVADGKINAQINDITNVEFLEGMSEDVLPKMAKDGINADILILDPPRKGISKTVLNSVLKLSAKHIIYVSCNPSTLARDLKDLEDADMGQNEGKLAHNGYKTKRITPIDMFPQTYHVESIAWLVRDDIDGSVRNMEES